MNKFRSISIYCGLVVVTVMLLFGARFMADRLENQVVDHRLRFTGELKNAPVLVTFTTVALGSFRGLVADLLWLRSGSLQEKGNYFEMVQLARWITDLQPTFSGATVYLAWNMAYNISVTCSSPVERWRWVNEGIRLIRDQAIEYNPEDPVLYKDLAWIFQHKVGNILDDANLYYKNRLALQMGNIVGSSNPNWEELAAAPASVKEFLKFYPEEDESPKSIWSVAKAAGYANFEALYKAFKTPEPAALPEKFTAGIGEKLQKELTAYFRAQLLRDKLKLDPREIVKINRQYGALDWRVPESQAIYWATIGLQRTPGNRDLNCSRLITQSLYESFRAGRLLMVDDRNFESIVVVPNLALVDAVYKTYEDTQNMYDKGNMYSTFRSARINFIKEAIGILYNYGKFKKADEYYKLLCKEEPQRVNESVENFVLKSWAEDVRDASVKKASEVISGLIYRSISYLVYNDNDAALANERIARYIYNKYSLDMGSMERTKLPPYQEMKRVMTENFLRYANPAIAAILRAKIAAEQAEKSPLLPRQFPVNTNPERKK